MRARPAHALHCPKWNMALVVLRLLFMARAMRFHLDALAKQIPGHLWTLMSYVRASALSWMREMKGWCKADVTTQEVLTVMRSRKAWEWRHLAASKHENPQRCGGVWPERHLKLWFHRWNSHSCEAQTLLTWQRFTPGSLLTGTALPTIGRLRGTFKRLLFPFIFYSCKKTNKHPGHLKKKALFCNRSKFGIQCLRFLLFCFQPICCVLFL